VSESTDRERWTPVIRFAVGLDIVRGLARLLAAAGEEQACAEGDGGAPRGEPTGMDVSLEPEAAWGLRGAGTAGVTRAALAATRKTPKIVERPV
jgi:hypothetical protein